MALLLHRWTSTAKLWITQTGRSHYRMWQRHGTGPVRGQVTIHMYSETVELIRSVSSSWFKNKNRLSLTTVLVFLVLIDIRSIKIGDPQNECILRSFANWNMVWVVHHICLTLVLLLFKVCDEIKELHQSFCHNSREEARCTLVKFAFVWRQLLIIDLI